MAGNLKQLISTRGNYRGQVNVIYNDKQNFSGYDLLKITNLVTNLQRLQRELSELNPKIRDLKWNLNAEDESNAEHENELELKLSTEYDIKLIESLNSLNQLTAQGGPSPANNQNFQSMLKNPVAPLPKFASTEGENLNKFFTLFEETTNRFNYSAYDKLILLKQQVSGRALTLLNSLEVENQSYTVAKDLLINALASPAVQKFNVFKQMSELKLDYSTDPFEYIAKIKSIEETFKSLNVTTEDILQYFTWSGLNETFKTQFIQITNESKPSFAQIKDKFFDASERYLNVQKNFKSKYKNNERYGEGRQSKSITGLAANVDFKRDSHSIFKSCPLCTDDRMDSSHSISKCTKFPDAKAKLDKLAKLKACAKCAKFNHSTDKCRFHFNRKCSCGAWHFEFLCTTFPSIKDNSKGKESETKREAKKYKSRDFETKQSKEETKKVTESGLVHVEETLQANDSSNTALPTFSCVIQGNKDIHCMRDSGCQSNFILDKIAVDENLEIIRNNIQLKVNGFNSSKVYHTKSVKVKLTIGGEDYEVEALCIPFIRTVLELPGLDTIVREFTKKGYQLADKILNNDNIRNIEFILGSISAYCLKESHVGFGEIEQNEPSVYSNTAAGVMLVGSIDQMLKNLTHLPTCPINPDNTYVRTEVSYLNSSITYESLGFHSTSYMENLDENLEINEAEARFAVINDKGQVVHSELKRATDQILDGCCYDMLCYDRIKFPEDSVENNNKIVNYVLNNTIQNDEGRLVMPIIWNGKVSHLLGRNQNLARQILKSNFKKLSKNETHLKMVDQTFKEQVENGIIERIEDLDQFLVENPGHSFLAHMAVFKLERETTKCRVVFLSNLCEKINSQSVTLSHNQAMLSGPSLNQKITSALLYLRFDEKVLCFDIKKAFLNIALNTVDQSKLLFLWFKNVEKGDFSIVGYKSLRLPFGLVCSPCLLLLGLFKILMIDTEGDSEQIMELKKLIYSLTYMDNCAITCNDPKELEWAYENLESIFEPYKFQLQQFITNDQNLQRDIDIKREENTPEEVKLLGLIWNRELDTLSTRPFALDTAANTKRLILKSIASHFDIYGFTGPILNRARLFLHALQCDKNVSWDKKLSEDLSREWKNISKQVNATPEIKVKRFIGRRDGSYKLLAFTDSSKSIYGVTVFIQDIDSSEVSFLLAKNRFVNKQLQTKSIPSLEFQAISLGTEILIDIYQELAGPTCVTPIKITELQLFSDSMVSLCWINSYTHKLEKMNKKSVFILNRLSHICELCEIHPIKFQFVSGIENPADQLTRPISYRQLMKSNYFSGPEFLKNTINPKLSEEDSLSIIVPNPLAKLGEMFPEVSLESEVKVNTSSDNSLEHLVLVDKCSSFYRLVKIHKRVLEFINRLKAKVKQKDPDKFKHMVVEEDLFTKALGQIIQTEQRIYFSDVFEYFERKNKRLKDIPNLVKQLNVYLDQQGILRVKSKFARWKNDNSTYYPILLPKKSQLTYLIVIDLHRKYFHAGCYSLLSELRKRFWVPHYFSVVKGILKDCVTCRRFKEHTIKLNQSPYRDFRLDPPNIPFRYIFIDHLGPYYVKLNGQKTKVWILCISCMWSRAINLKVCMDLTTKEFLRALQLHCFEYGIPQFCLSDLGSTLVAGANIITDFLRDPDTQQYFEENNVRPLTFDQYFKGCHQLGSLVEISVKLVKRLIYGSIKNNVLEFRDFEFLICHTVHLVNRRPIAFQEGLRDSSNDTVPNPITPEKLIHGHDLVSLNIIPDLQPDPDPDPDWLINTDPVDKVLESYQKLKKARSRLIDTYNSEFLSHLMSQAVNAKSRYQPVNHKALQKGDIVLLKEDNCKMNNYPMGIVKEIRTNCNDEVTGVTLLKGKTREVVKRHVSSLIPILSVGEPSDSSSNFMQNSFRTKEFDKVASIKEDNTKGHVKFKRKAAEASAEKTRLILAKS